MTGADLKQLRHSLGDAIGRRLTHADMAKICGLAPKNGGETMRKWEAGEGPSGPVASLLDILACASTAMPIEGQVIDAGKAVLEAASPDAPKGLLVRAALADMLQAEILRRLAT